MKKLITALSVAAASLWLAAPAQAEVDVGVSIAISQPGVYGRIDIGQFPQPRVLVPQPLVVVPAPRRMQPVYMWVPPGHRKNWKRHCSDYGACGVPVYFVDHRWYDNHVRHSGPYYRADRGADRGADRRDDRRGDARDDRRDGRDDRRDDRRGNGKGNGNGNGKGRGN
jgi:hypothetical protein